MYAFVFISLKYNDVTLRTHAISRCCRVGSRGLVWFSMRCFHSHLSRSRGIVDMYVPMLSNIMLLLVVLELWIVKLICLYLRHILV